MELRDNWIAIAAIVLGLLILAFPDILKWLIGIALVVGGIVAIVNKRY